MARRVRRLAVLLVVLVIAGAVVLVLTTRPQLEDRRDDVDGAWTPLRGPLTARYDRLAAVNAQMAAAGAGERAIARELETTLTRWARLRQAGDANADAEAETETANQLEGLATRLQAVVLSSDRLRGIDPLNQAIAAFQGSAATPPVIETYNDAVEEYEDTRTSLLRRPAADLFGFDSRRQLALGS
jgi:hypothetical protein